MFFIMYNELVIDLRKIKQNIQKIRKQTDKKIISVVKADAYGHGAVMVANYIQDMVDMLAVSSVDEAKTLADHGIYKDILVLAEAQYFLQGYDNIIYMVDDCKNLPTNARVHIAVNSGMNRYGVDSRQDFISLVYKLNINNDSIEGVFTHFYSHDTQDVSQQLDKFNDITLDAQFPRHLSASHTALLDIDQDYIRLGISQYHNAKSINCRVVRIHLVHKGDHIGYNHTLAQEDMAIAVLSIGYADGIDCRLKNNWQVRINGKYYHLIGDICMDCCFAVVDSDVKVGDLVQFVDSTNNLAKMSKRIGTIEYELMCRLTGERYKKKYLF